jgi:SAM-dependent methyltransferase
MSLKESILERSFVYRAWQALQAEQKFAPVLEKNDFKHVHRVLDVACGPGINTRHFAQMYYLGIDVNEKYVQDAKRRHGRDFMVADARKLDGLGHEPFDFILVNSFLHHLSAPDAYDVLSSLDLRLAPDGHVHILEPVLPDDRSIARLLASWDRGEFVRPLGEWQALFSKTFAPVLFERYSISAAGIVLWNMLYFKGKSKR